MTSYFLRVLIALDQLANVAICNGEPDETMSSAAWRMERDGHWWGFMRRVIDALASPWQQDHCRKAFESEKLDLQLPAEFQTGEPSR